MSSNTDTHGLGGAYSETMAKATASKAESSQQLRSETFATAYGGSIAPPYPPARLAELIEVNTTHAKAGFSKARNVAGYGLEVVPHPEVEAPDESQREIAKEFWFSGESDWQVGPLDAELATPADVCEMAWADYEFIGWLSIEALTQTDGTPVGLAYIPAPTIRKREDAPGFVQEVNGELRYFGSFGDRYGDGRNNRVFVDTETGEYGPVIDGDVANEIIWKRNHTPFVENYGTPDIIPAIPDIDGATKAREFNVDFFGNNAVPRLAVIVEGGQLTEGARSDIHNLFHGLKDNDHSTAILEVEKLLDDPSQINFDGEDNDVRISVKPVTVGTDEDASFLEYQHHTEHEILKAHDVPPVEAGTVESGAFSTDAEQQRKGYIETVIQPKQASFSELLYETIHQALGVTDWTIEFKTQGYDTRLSDAEVAKTKAEASMGTATVNEVRGWLDLEPLDTPVGEMLLAELGGGSPAGPGGGEGIGEQVEEMVDMHVEEAREELQRDLTTELRVSRPFADDD